MNADSSISRSRLSISRPSATILSPISRRIISPFTTFFLLIIFISPSRITFTAMSSYILFSASNALSELPSINMVIPTESTTAKSMPKHSAKSPSPVFNSFPIFAPSAIKKPKRSIISIGSLSAAKIFEKTFFLLFTESELSPYLTRFFSACASVSPRRASERKSFIAVSGFLR